MALGEAAEPPLNYCRVSPLLINTHESFSISPLSRQGLFLFTSSLIVRFPFHLMVRTQGGESVGKRENPRLSLLMGRFLGGNSPRGGSKADAFNFLIKTKHSQF